MEALSGMKSINEIGQEYGVHSGYVMEEVNSR